MQQLIYQINGILIFSLFTLILPFLITVVLPAVLIPLSVKQIMTIKYKKLPSIKPFIVVLITGAFIADMIWIFKLFDLVYFKDDLIYNYSFLINYNAVANISNFWEAKGLQMWQLDFIWILTTWFIFFAAAYIAWYLEQRKTHIKAFQTFLIVSILCLAIVAFILPQKYMRDFLHISSEPRWLNNLQNDIMFNTKFR